MILRPHPGGTLLIGQPAHAWLSGQLARSWGSAAFGGFEPREEVCLAALQHDVGMAAWDAEPQLDTDTGLPYGFSSMPRELHVALWSRAATLVLAQNRYAALLVSLHGTGLYERYVPAATRRREPVRSYLAREHALQLRLAASLDADRELLERNRNLLRCWDWLSLFLCTGAERRARLEDVPAAEGAVVLELRREESRVTVAPWPFRESRLELRVEGRLLEGRFTAEEPLRAALAAAPWRTLELALEPAAG